MTELPDAYRGQPRLGRLPSVDPNNRRFSLAPRAAPTKRTFRSWLAPAGRSVLDQGFTPHCVAYSGLHFLKSLPVVNHKGLPNPAAVYAEAQTIDEWAGQDYDGTSVNAGLKVLRRLGYVESWRWAYDLQAALDHLMEVGPLWVGTSWLSNMWLTDHNGYLSASGYLEGGHAYLIVAANLRRRNPDGTTGAVRMLNNWGSGWGQSGRAWISLADFEKLIADWGEIAAPQEKKLVTNPQS